MAEFWVRVQRASSTDANTEESACLIYLPPQVVNVGQRRWDWFFCSSNVLFEDVTAGHKGRQNMVLSLCFDVEEMKNLFPALINDQLFLNSKG